MSWPYIAQDEKSGGWYADVEGVISGEFPAQAEAYQFALDRLAHALGQERHGCYQRANPHLRWVNPPCRLHEPPDKDTEVTDAMRKDLTEYTGRPEKYVEYLPDKLVWSIWINAFERRDKKKS